MKITIYVNHKHLDNLMSLIHNIGEPKEIEWYHDRPGWDKFIMVTLNYGDFKTLETL